MTPPTAPREVTGLILCGGRGLRMGGADKGWALLQGRPLVAHVAQRLAPQVHTLLVSANRNLEAYRAIAPVVTDPGDLEPYAGPLAGILAALRIASTPWVAVVPCDTPNVPTDLVRRLAEGLDSAAAAYAATDGEDHPLACLLAAALRTDLEDALRAGTRRAGQWLRQVGARAVRFGDRAAFANLNAPTDLAAAGMDVHR